LSLKETYTLVTSKSIMKLRKALVHVELYISVGLFVIVFGIVYKNVNSGASLNLKRLRSNY
jgi:hypothetical protein